MAGVLISTTVLDHLPVMNSILIGYVVDSKPSSLFNISVSHLESVYLKSLVHSVWNLVPCPRGDKGWILWWDVTIFHNVNLNRG
jgi:hypothetical protein